MANGLPLKSKCVENYRQTFSLPPFYMRRVDLQDFMCDVSDLAMTANLSAVSDIVLKKVGEIKSMVSALHQMYCR